MEYDYKDKIIEMVEKIEDIKFLSLLYGLISESIKIVEKEINKHAKHTDW